MVDWWLKKWVGGRCEAIRVLNPQSKISFGNNELHELLMNNFEMVSKEDHEVNYLLKKWLNHQLKKWGKKQSIENRKKLVEKLDEFRSAPNYQRLNRDDSHILFNLIDMFD